MGALARHDWDEAARLGSEAGRLGDEQGFPYLAAVADSIAGLAAAQAGDDAAIDRFTRSLGELAATGSRTGAMWVVAWVTEALLTVGRLDEALSQVESGLALSRANDEKITLAELHRLKGEILVAMEGPRTDHAEVLLRKAIELARAQGARIFELRAATSLARLWRDRGRHAEARELLQPVYDWVSEGFDTQDLREGKALLEALAESS
jgi:predicted ATPase